MKLSYRNNLALALFASCLLALCPAALAGNPAHGWRGAASTGVLDSDGAQDVLHLGSMTTIDLSAPAGTRVKFRFDVNPDKILYPDMYTLSARLFDGGSGERVVATLKSIDLASGAVRTHMSLNSDSYSQRGWETLHKSTSRYPGFSISDDSKAFYVEVELKKNTSGALPILMGIAINGCIL